MNDDFRNAFEALAERGDARGATALLERLEATQHVATPIGPTNQLRGILVAAAAFVAVLALGVGLFVGSRPVPDTTNERFLDGRIRWVDTTREFAAVEWGSSGPGGFIMGYDDGFAFSPDGFNWTPVDIPPSDQPGTVQASDDLWVISYGTSYDGSYWVSSDAQTWTEVPVHPEIRLESVTGQGFLGFKSRTETYWSEDLVEWTQIDGALPNRAYRQFFGTAGGAAYVGAGWDNDYVIAVTDGATWTRSQLNFKGEFERALLVELAYTNGIWVAILDPVGEDDEMGLHVWTSPNAQGWKYRGPVDIDPGGIPMEINLEPFAHLPTIVQNGGLFGSKEVWISEDGIKWELALSGDEPFLFLAKANGDGTYRGIRQSLPAR